jgi:hypothetical protein
MYGGATPLVSILYAKGELLDHGIGEDFSGDPIDFGLGSAVVEAVVEGQDEILSLAHVSDGAVLHAAKRICDCLALSIEDRSF